MPHESIANAMMVTGAYDRMNGTRLKPTYQDYNNFSVRTVGGNIIQGQVNRIKVTEVFFPYAIPTVVDTRDGDQAANNTISVIGVETVLSASGTILVATPTVLQITVPAGFYNGAEMATAINNALAAGPGAVFANLTVDWNDVSNRIIWTNSGSWDGADGASDYFYNILSYSGAGVSLVGAQLQRPLLSWTLGLRSLAAKYTPIEPLNAAAGAAAFSQTYGPLGPWLVPGGYPNVAGTSTPQLPVWPVPYAVNSISGSPYTGRYTDFIDIVSHNLCGAQYVRDGNTNQNTVRRDIVARLYVADEVSLAGNYETGSRPFLIHRQFKCPKTMFWNVERSIDSIDLQLYDMYGQPLPTGLGMNPDEVATWLVGDPGDYAVTFQVEEGTISEQLGNNGYRM